MRRLCSHLVRIRRHGLPNDEFSALLEEISESELLLASESSLDKGDRIVVDADGFRAEAIVDSCSSRGDDFAIVCEFAPGFRWSPSLWTPDHLYDPRRKPNAARPR